MLVKMIVSEQGGGGFFRCNCALSISSLGNSLISSSTEVVCVQDWQLLLDCMLHLL